MSLKRIFFTESRENQTLLLTPRLDRWLASTGGSLVLTSERMALMSSLLQKAPRDRSQGFSGSASGSCPRRQMFTYIGLPERRHYDSVLFHRFIDGTFKHIKWQMMLLTADLLTDIEVPIEIPELRLKGSMDGLDDRVPFGWELKSTQAFSYYMTNGPGEAHLRQVHAYFLARPDIERFSLIYEDTTSRDWKEFVVERDAERLLDTRRQLEALNEYADNKRLPPVIPECALGKGQTFKDCTFSHKCLTIRNWTDAEALAADIPSGRGTPEPVRPPIRIRRVSRRPSRQG